MIRIEIHCILFQQNSSRRNFYSILIKKKNVFIPKHLYSILFRSDNTHCLTQRAIFSACSSTRLKHDKDLLWKHIRPWSTP